MILYLEVNMRFIFNFIFFGILFYIIYLFFPDAFQTLVSWVSQIYTFLRDLIMQLVKKVEHVKNSDSVQTQMKLLQNWISS